jgi:glycosyltransferase involved in cell wall biosynthesis
LRAWLKWRLLQGWDARLARRFDAVVTVSDLDRNRLLARWPGGARRVAVIPNGVDTEALQPLPPAPAPPTLLFVGTLGYEPNMDAAQFLATEIFPRVRAVCPAARLVIAGQHAAPSVLALAPLPQVSVQVNVADLRPLYQQAQVVVVPLRAGGGTRLKILEALALGRPVVSTTIGAEGLDLAAGAQLRLADSAEAFAQAVLDLLGDPAAAAALAERGRAAVAARYAWPLVAARALAHYRQLVGPA